MDRVEQRLWGFAILVGAMDIATTIVGLDAGLVETNPLIRPILNGDPLPPLISVKVVGLALAGIIRPFLPTDIRYVIPLGLSIPWIAATLVNIIAIVTI